MMHAPGKMALSAIVLLLAFSFRPSVAQQTNTTAITNTTTTTTTTSNTTSAMEMTTANDTATTTEATTTTSTTTIPPTTTQPPYDLDHLKTAFYTLQFTVGPTNASNIQYNESMSMATLLMRFKDIFSSFSQDVELLRSSDDNRTYILVVTFLYEKLDNSTVLEEKVMKAKNDIEMAYPMYFSIPNTNITDGIVAQFLNATMDICQAMDVCPIGFSCNSMGCESLCRMEDCSGHGMCYVILLSNNTAQTMCNCDDTYDTEYEGDRCQDDRRGRDQIIAILAGVLGTACFILLVICILLCVFYCRRNKEYNFTPRTHTNQAFDGTHTSKN